MHYLVKGVKATWKGNKIYEQMTQFNLPFAKQSNVFLFIAIIREKER